MKLMFAGEMDCKLACIIRDLVNKMLVLKEKLDRMLGELTDWMK